MSEVYAEIELVNSLDIEMSRRGYVNEGSIRKIIVSMHVNTKFAMLGINEEVQHYLQLPVREKRKVVFNDGKIIECQLVGPVDVKFNNRSTLCNAVVLPGDTMPLLGFIPFGEMDVVIQNQQLVVNPAHPDGAVIRV